MNRLTIIRPAVCAILLVAVGYDLDVFGDFLEPKAARIGGTWTFNAAGLDGSDVSCNASWAELVANKRAAARLKDLADIEALGESP